MVIKYISATLHDGVWRFFLSGWERHRVHDFR